MQAAAARLRREGAEREADLRAAATAAAGEATAGAQLVAALAPDRDGPISELWRKVRALSLVRAWCGLRRQARRAAAGHAGAQV